MATVRVESTLHERLRALSAAEHRPISQVIEDAINRYETDKFWAAMYEGYARLQADPSAWRDYLDEAALWDSVSGDGLDREEPYFTEEEARNEVAASSASR